MKLILLFYICHSYVVIKQWLFLLLLQDKLADSSGCDNAKRRSTSRGLTPCPWPRLCPGLHCRRLCSMTPRRFSLCAHHVAPKLDPPVHALIHNSRLKNTLLKTLEDVNSRPRDAEIKLVQLDFVCITWPSLSHSDNSTDYRCQAL